MEEKEALLVIDMPEDSHRRNDPEFDRMEKTHRFALDEMEKTLGVRVIRRG